MTALAQEVQLELASTPDDENWYLPSPRRMKMVETRLVKNLSHSFFCDNTGSHEASGKRGKVSDANLSGSYKPEDRKKDPWNQQIRQKKPQKSWNLGLQSQMAALLCPILHSEWVCQSVILPSNGFPQFMCCYKTAQEVCSAKYPKKQVISL